ncbi:MAG: phosphoenolpyruvate--protein phosphotransferase [Anaerolineae bacterium]|nr:phosphoenolpyruvate--protein phosphotransferase [Anaerolineae bacterium]
MIGIVIVSHSARLADGVVELAREMAGPDVLIAAAGGLDLPDRPLGTDAVLVMNAIEQVYSDDGVLVLMDLGSAILSAEMARDLLDPDRQPKVRLSSGPLVEGAIAAAVQARLGSSLDQVVREAFHALGPKGSHFDEARVYVPPAEAVAESAAPEAQQHRITLTVRNRLGLHARPAARLVQTVGQHQAEVQVRNATGGRGPVSARSINGLATLGVRHNDTLEVTASGADAQAALDAICALADNNFGDSDQDQQVGAGLKPAPTGSSLPQVTDNVLVGIPASPGLAVGPLHAFRLAVPDVPQHTITDPQAAWESLTAAIQQTRAQIQRTRATIRDERTAGIFDAHLLFLDDDALLSPTRRAIFEDKLNAAAAWDRAVESVADSYRSLDDPYLRTRAADIQEVGQQVLLQLLDRSAALPVMREPGILSAIDLTAADVAHLDPAAVHGLCTAFGGATSHSAILAHTLNIPLIVGLGDAILNIPDGTPVIMDGDTGQVMVKPDEVALRDYMQRIESQQLVQAQALAASAAPAVTRDGRRMEIVANIGSVADAQAAVRMGAEGVGVLRTEFLFLNRQTAPSADEQYTAYRAIAQALEGRPLIIRTLDVGGDKPLPYIEQPTEANPFLGMRAIRLCLAQPDLFKAQLRAAARTAAEFPVKIMFPMIATLDEFRAAKRLLAEVCAAVNIAPAQIETGIMVEIPAAALCADQFAPEVDFFSIGTNDLTQYTLAAERGNPQLATLTDAFQPAVLQLIRQVVEAAHARGKWVGVCGEMGGDPLAVPLLVGLGVDELSMNAPAIPRVKQIIRSLDYTAVIPAALDTLTLASADAVRAAAHALMTPV